MTDSESEIFARRELAREIFVAMIGGEASRHMTSRQNVSNEVRRAFFLAESFGVTVDTMMAEARANAAPVVPPTAVRPSEPAPVVAEAAPAHAPSRIENMLHAITKPHAVKPKK